MTLTILSTGFAVLAGPCTPKSVGKMLARVRSLSEIALGS
jgi:hypothetical protein